MPSSADSGPAVVVTTSYPLYLMAQELAHDVVVVRYAVPEGRMPQTWTPLSDDIQKLQAADIVLFSGAGYEPWAQKLSLPRSRTVDTSSGYSDKLLHVADSITHQHGPVGQQSDRDVIPTSWLDPQLAVAQLGRVEEQLLKIAPNATDAISRRATAFRNSFDNLEHKLEQLRADSAGRKISVAADDTDFQYLISRLAWRNQHISWAEDGTLTAEFTEQLASDPPLLILIRQDCERKRAEVLQATGVSCIAVDTCESAHGKAKAADRLVARLSANLDRLRRELGL
ncbi:MAG: metal ABC transporter substrate-binding protein [Fuerstiella sp.]|nr:metal ABC transporter substrate-binding protein [Fuerstiella sp.]